MECPKNYKAKEKTEWNRLMANFNPTNPVEEEMGVRYFNWIQLYHINKSTVDKEGSVTHGKNGVPYPNPAYTNMVKAEGEMRRLYAQIKNLFEHNKQEPEGGEFSNL